MFPSATRLRAIGPAGLARAGMGAIPRSNTGIARALFSSHRAILRSTLVSLRFGDVPTT